MNYRPKLLLDQKLKADHYERWQIRHIYEQQNSCVFLNRQCLFSQGPPVTEGAERHPDSRLKVGV